MWLQDFHTRVDGALLGEDLAKLLYKVFKSGHEQGAARAAKSAVCKLEIKVSATGKTYFQAQDEMLYDSLCDSLCHSMPVTLRFSSLSWLLVSLM